MSVKFPHPLVYKSPGKINLFLHVTGKRNDGYHCVETAFQFLNFFDTLTFEITTDKIIQRVDDHPFHLPADDLIVHAAELLRKEFNGETPGVKITLNKKIPPGSGMGGGSSNAAITLLALNELWNTQFSHSKLQQIGLALGADVPVFIYGKSCWATGVGEIFRPFEPEASWYCFCIPDVSVSTATIFNHPDLERNHLSISHSEYHCGNTSNDLEKITRLLYPEVNRAFEILSEFGEPRMNGSGSSLFLPCISEQAAHETICQLPNDLNCFVAQSSNNFNYK